ncbi:hypothetical protein AGOR_G00113690 [Albula goreensis]|uniref:Little elongation complex subunit 1 C-terminal domain-containing protein n=1 Tax=Albula goreensis TaxID=1534307 RepID=A0A8T3DBT6_9TELE|nr:hypothetical protein AGOR_G00113690 [Albula goreensis]
MFRNPAVRSRKRQHSSKDREATPVNLKEEHKSTNLVLANDDISSPAKSPTSIRKVRSEMGPPLPPLLNPLEVTPPRFGRFGTKTVSSQLSFASPVNEETLVQENPVISPLSDGSDVKSPCLSVPPSCDTKRRRVLPSPLQFCATTPKHAVPVPGRLPPSASSSSSSSPSAPQENSVRILDTMYPDLSARARTLNILRRTVNLNRSDSGMTAPDSVGQISRFKAVGSSTVSTKPSEPNEREIRFNQPEENANPSEGSSTTPASQFGKRSGVNIILPKTAKKLRQAGDSPVPPSTDSSVIKPEQVSQDPPVHPLPDVTVVKSGEVSQGQSDRITKEEQVGDTPTSTPNPILDALKKIEMSCFDLLPVIKSHVSIGRISKVPVLSDEEKEVIHEFCVVKKLMADDLLPAILVKMKTEKDSLPGTYMQALCRVYIGICRQKEDWERAHLFAYSILKEDFPDAAKLILFMVTTWYNFLSHRGLFCKALHAVVRMRAQGEVLQYLTAYLGWEKNPPCQTKELITSLVMAMKMGVKMKFLQHDRHGNDLNPPAWEYVYCLDLLCAQEHWKWTHDNIICKNLWPIMNSWVSQSRSVQTPIADVAVATILRLIGRLGQLGMREKSLDSVRNVAKVINTFGRHGRREGVPWPVQLAAVYAIYDLSPSNPKEALDALAAWREEVTEPVPPAISSCMMQIGSICRHIKS